MKVFQNKNGFTLIEILIATVIITIVSLGLSSLTLGIMRGNSFSKQLTTATTLAQDRLEHIKRIGYANAGTLGAIENYGNIANYGEYKRVTSVSNNTPMSNTRTITVVVYWRADKHFVNLTTILAE